MSNSAACREVGVNRKTGNRWRYGRKVIDRAGREHSYPPITEERDTGAISARYLSEDERLVIADLLRAGNSLRAMLGDSAGTPPRSAGRCAATVTRAPASTTRSRPSGARPCAEPAPGRVSYVAIRS
jgi:nucleoid-associated protein YgaU